MSGSILLVVQKSCHFASGQLVLKGLCLSLDFQGLHNQHVLSELTDLMQNDRIFAQQVK